MNIVKLVWGKLRSHPTYSTRSKRGELRTQELQLQMESITLMAVIVAAVTLGTASATTHVVGGSTGWTIPPNATFYSDWASSQTIAPGDKLVFNFPQGAHDVAKVPKSSYDSCSTASQIGTTLNNGPATVTVASGTHYYICAFPGHCSAGQKLAVTVTAAATTVSTPAAAPKVAVPVPAAAPVVANSPTTLPSAESPVPADAPAPGVASFTADTPAAGPSGNGSSSAPVLRTGGAVVAVVIVAMASLLV